MIKINKIKLHNFKRFQDLIIEVDPKMNIFIGDNESGKSSILQAIDLVARGSRTRVEEIGLDRLFNAKAITSFMNGPRNPNEIPLMFVELYFNNQMDESLEGMNNSERKNCCGIKMVCEYDRQYSQQISRILREPNATFPMEFFTVRFDTFSGETYIAYTKKLKCLCVDNSQIGSPYAMREYVREIYRSQLDELQRVGTKHSYHQSKVNFQNTVLTAYNVNIAPFNFAVRESVDDNIETDVTLVENNIPIESKGSGMQCFIKTDLSLKRAANGVDAVLIEEPENHLSYTNVLELIEKIKGDEDRQIFITTHSDLIATRLNLKKCILLNSSNTNAVKLDMLNDDTADFFMKAPDNNMLQFVLSRKTILVEGDAEFILMGALYKRTQNRTLEESGIGVISVDGKCFKRYLEIADKLNNRVAVITDNDHNYDENITNSYADYNEAEGIKIFSDTDNDRYTFEVCIYQDNKDICDTEFASPHRRLDIRDYMLSNKAEAAYTLSKKRADEIVVPQYIQDAIRWIDV